MKDNWKVIALLHAAMVYVPQVKIERKASALSLYGVCSEG
jgi:hypothetical protein